MAIRTVTYPVNPNDNVGAPLTPPVGIRAWVDGNLIIDAANPQPPGVFQLNLSVGPHDIQMAQLSQGVQGDITAVQYIEPSGVPAAIDPAGIVIT